MTAADRAALEIGRLFMRAFTAETANAQLAQENADLKAKLAEFTNGVEKPRRKTPVKT